MLFQGSGIDFQLENRSQIDEKIPSKMECLNLCPVRYENQAQDAPKTPQDARGSLERRFKDPQDTTRAPQDAPKTPPKTPQDVPKTRPSRSDRLQEPARPPPDLDFGPFWQRF